MSEQGMSIRIVDTGPCFAGVAVSKRAPDDPLIDQYGPYVAEFTTAATCEELVEKLKAKSPLAFIGITARVECVEKDFTIMSDSGTVVLSE